MRKRERFRGPAFPTIDTDQEAEKPRRNRGDATGRGYRAYTDDDRAAAVVLYHATGGHLHRTARLLNMPPTTLRKWLHDGARPADPRRVLEAGATLDAKLEAYLGQLFEIGPDEFPRTSLLDHTRAIVLLVDALVKLRAACQPVAAQLADADPQSKPLDLTQAPPADLAALRAWLDRAAPPVPAAKAAGE